MATKQKRFRFSERDRLQLIDEVFNHVCEDVSTTEDDLWQSVHTNLCRDNIRFVGCSLRLLKEHTLEQVIKYKSLDSIEAAESGKERLKTVWGEKMKMLLEVWPNYEELVKLEISIKSVRLGGRPKRAANTKRRETQDLAKKIRDAALNALHIGEETSTSNLEIDDINPEFEQTETEQVMEIENVISETPSTSRSAMPAESICTKNTQKRRYRNQEKDPAVWTYLAEKSQNELSFHAKQHHDEMDYKNRKLDLEKERLEFERERWHAEQEEKRRNAIANEATTSLLTVLLQSDLLRKHNGNLD